MNPLIVLQARADARALLFQAAEYDNLGEALAPLLVHADETGITEDIGVDGVLAIVRKAFEGIAEV